MKLLFAITVVALFTFGCNAQSVEKDKKGTQNKPKESWKVDKEVDENGNVVRYDSTYTWSYSNVDGDTINVNVDSLMQSFQSYFNDRMPSVFGQNFMEPMLNDSLLPRDLFGENYFHDRFKDEFFDMDKMIQQMDSIRSQFLKDDYPQMHSRIHAPHK
ncbi:hypothetical protein [Maribellus sediminis]|uniref:hypothetical protein n=1 Tax=Maribellus sediminis TaxID=2696285 RepID=UPI001430CE9A|nr:hypothetical protein [Maribellus sediminis]